MEAALPWSRACSDYGSAIAQGLIRDLAGRAVPVSGHDYLGRAFGMWQGFILCYTGKVLGSVRTVTASYALLLQMALAS